MDSTKATADGEAEAPTGTIVLDTRTVRRPVGRVYWISAVVTVVLLTIAIGVSRGPALEQSLKKDVLAALDRAGLGDVGVSVDGRMVTANVPTGADADEVKDVVDGVDGVSAVTAMLVYSSYAEAKGCANLQEKLDRVTRNQRIPFAGASVRPTSAGLQMLRAVAELLEGCPPARVYVGGHTDPSTRFGSTVTLNRARTMTKLLKSFGVAVDQLAPRGYGDQFPIDKSGNNEARNERGSIIVRSQ